MLTKNKLLDEATNFITDYYNEMRLSQKIQERLKQIESDIEVFGTYEHTFEELVYGAKVAWRNNNRCIGRLFWDKLSVLDARDVNDVEGIYNALIHHIQYATNGGKIKPTITIFKQYKGDDNNIRIYNHQLIRYAGYETEKGIIGDSQSIDFTKKCENSGWSGSKSHFDVLPLVFSIDGGIPIYKQIPKEDVKEVIIEHPEYPIRSLGVRWYGIPIISSMRLEIGGISYTAAPFNGWYMGTEIGARNLADEDRYNILPNIADVLGLDTQKNSMLWKDRALVELNIAVLHSFKKEGVTIVDHHTAAQQFLQFEKQEVKCGRMVTGNWVWLVPPLSPATTHIYHKPYSNKIIRPNYFLK
ncbi:nitric oxide synthase oxygenase [Bacillus cereus]|uniref:Nitric oxide synthase oxygenase n=1 Tax=Bacillus cereus TaxID=1396 RepID=A0AB73UCN5_BACCE|nr:nitric oxide synthase oxygenase [Bacillus cereus]QHV03716.1 nitric oxide synthase [Bacillus cereus]QHV41722.1 nitric oxide synthase oxygenase [Bacillus cereus]